ncbi:MAG: MMPL family transporter [Cycloclasticus sp.]
MHRFERYFSEWVIRYRLPIIIINLLVVIAAGSGLKLLGFNTDYRVFFGEDNPDLIAFNALEATYSKSDNVFILVAPKKSDIFQPPVLSIVEELTELSWQMPFSRRVDSLQNFQNTYAEEDDLVVENLYENVDELSVADVKRVKKVALADPLLFKRLVSEEGLVTAVNVTIEFPGVDRKAELGAVISYSRGMIDEFKTKYPDVDFYVTGVTFLNNAFVEAGERDVKSLVPLSFLAMIILLFILLKSVSAVFGVMLVIILSVVTAMGIGGYLGIALTPASISSVQMIMVLAVASSVHMLVSFLFGLQHKDTKLHALSESLRVNIQPIVLTSLTTMVGFLGMNFSEVPPFHDLGNLVAMGLCASLCLSLTFLPALMSFLPVHVKVEEDPGVGYLAGIAAFVIKRQNIVLVVMSGVVLVSAYCATFNQPEERFLKYFDTSMQFRVDTDFATENLGGLYQLMYAVPAGSPGGISRPEYLKNLDLFNDWIKSQPEVINTYVLTDTMRRLNKNMHGDEESWYVLPESRELAAQYLLLYEMSLPYGLDLNNQVNVDKSETRLIATMVELSNVELLNFEKRVQAWYGKNMPEFMNTQGTGTLMMFAHVPDKNIKGMLYGSILALFIISMILIVALRSLKVGLISLAPNLVPLTIGFGLWGLLYVEVNMALAVVVSMTLGIVVDDTVHFLSKYLRAKREKGYDSEQAITYAFTHVGKALVVSTVVLMIGFGVLMTSPFALNSDMAMLTTWIICLALIVDFLLLPVLLLRFDKDEK